MNKTDDKKMNDAEEVIELKDKKEFENDKINKTILIIGISILLLIILCICSCFCLSLGIPILGSTTYPGATGDLDYYYKY